MLAGEAGLFVVRQENKRQMILQGTFVQGRGALPPLSGSSSYAWQGELRSNHAVEVSPFRSTFVLILIWPFISLGVVFVDRTVYPMFRCHSCKVYLCVCVCVTQKPFPRALFTPSGFRIYVLRSTGFMAQIREIIPTWGRRNGGIQDRCPR
jgi:hypothetical protein